MEQNQEFQESQTFHKCSICGVQTQQGCLKCQQAFYCSQEHQRQHWPIHKQTCKQIQQQQQQSTENNDSFLNKQKPQQEKNTKFQKDQIQPLDFSKTIKQSVQTPIRQKINLPLNNKELPGSPSKIKYSTNNSIMINKGNNSSKREANQDDLQQQMLLEHNSLRQQSIIHFTKENYSLAQMSSKKLLEYSKKIFGAGKKNEQLELISDYLLVAKMHITLDEFNNSRVVLLEAKNQIMQITKEFLTSINLKLNSGIKEQDNIQDIEVQKLLSVIQIMSQLFYSCGDYKSCEILLAENVKIVETINGVDSLLTGESYFLMGIFYLQHKLYVQALACFKRTLNIRVNRFPESKDEGIADCWYNIGVIYKSLKKKTKAIQMIVKSLDLRKELIGDTSLQAAMCQETLGKLFLQQGDFKSALVKFTECLYTRKKILNKDEHKDIVRISVFIADLYQQIKKNIMDNTQGEKLQNLNLGIFNRAEQIIIDNNIDRYIKDFQPDFIQTQLQQNRKPQIQLQKVETKQPSDIQNYKNNKSGTDQLFDRSSSFVTQRLAQPQEVSNQDDQQSFRNSNQILKVRRQLLQQLKIDSMILLEELQKDLKLALKINPQTDMAFMILQSKFVKQLSSIQLSILKEDNHYLFDDQQGSPYDANSQNDSQNEEIDFDNMSEVQNDQQIQTKKLSVSSNKGK